MKTINVKQHDHPMIKFYLTNAYLADISAHSFLIKLDYDPPSIFLESLPAPCSSS